MKKSELKRIISEEVANFVERFVLSESEFKQKSSVMEDELGRLVTNLKLLDGYGHVELVDKDLYSLVMAGVKPIMRYDKDTYTLHHNFLPSAIAELIK